MTALKRRLMKAGTIDKDTLADRAPYIAGLLDGEGTFTIVWNRRARRLNFRPLIMVLMTHPDGIIHIAETF